MITLYGFSIQEHSGGSWYNNRRLYGDAEARDAAMSTPEEQEYPRTTGFTVECPDE